MNAILLGISCAGALAVFVTSDASKFESAKMNLPQTVQMEDVGSMTRNVQVDPETGDTAEISVIAFLD